MAVPMIAPFARQGMIEIAVRERDVRSEQPDYLAQLGIKRSAMLSGLFAFVVTLEAARAPNRPHSDRPLAP